MWAAVKAELAAQRRVQAIAGQHPPGSPSVRRRNAAGFLADHVDSFSDDLDVQVGHPRGQSTVQLRPPYPEPGTGPESVLHGEVSLGIPDADKWDAMRTNPEPVQRNHRARHQALTARLVHRRRAWFVDDHREPGQPGLDSGGQPDGTTAHHDDVEITQRTVARARSSVGIRTAISPRFATENTTAVTQAVCTMGSAKTSTATAT